MGSKRDQAWIWLAMDLETRRIVACWVGKRELSDARAFFERVPQEYFSGCIDTDRLIHYRSVLFGYGDVHTRWAKGSGMTSHIERFNLTMRNQLARLGRKTLKFSKKWSHLRAFVFHFLHHYNLHLAPRIAPSSNGIT